jgi:hypothetical protein
MLYQSTRSVNWVTRRLDGLDLQRFGQMSRCEELPILQPDAADIDVGASELFVAKKSIDQTISHYRSCLTTSR